MVLPVENRTHITRLPKAFVIVRILQLFFAIILLAFTIFENVVLATLGSVLGIIAAFISTVTLIWLLTATYRFPSAYNYWAILAFEIFLFLFYIPIFLFTLVDSFWLDDYLQPYCTREYNYATKTSPRVCRDPSVLSKAYGASLGLVAAMTGSLLVLYLVSLIVTSVFIGRHRSGGGHSYPGSAGALSKSEIQRRLDDEEALRLQNAELMEQISALRGQNPVAAPAPATLPPHVVA